MGEIITISLIANDLNNSKEFSKNVYESTNKMQSIGLEVEVQYQQNNMLFSALIIGRRKRTDGD